MISSHSSANREMRPNWSHRSTAHLGAALAISLGLLSSSPAFAQTLDGDTIRDLALQGTWAAQGAVSGFWSWSEDNTVCLRMGRVFDPDGDCADTGNWSINDNVMCYELTWLWESYDVRKNCYTVHPLEDGRYETRYHGGALDSTFTIFTVIE